MGFSTSNLCEFRGNGRPKCVYIRCDGGAYRVAINFKLNWKWNRNLINDPVFACHKHTNETSEKNSLFVEKHVYICDRCMWVWSCVHLFEILFHLVMVWFRFSLSNSRRFVARFILLSYVRLSLSLTHSFTFCLENYFVISNFDNLSSNKL